MPLIVLTVEVVFRLEGGGAYWRVGAFYFNLPLGGGTIGGGGLIGGFTVV